MTKDELTQRIAELEAEITELRLAAESSEARIAELVGVTDPAERQTLREALATLRQRYDAFTAQSGERVAEVRAAAEAQANELRAQLAAETSSLREQLAEVSPAAAETQRLAAFLLETYPDEPGRGNPQEGESAVDVAIRLLQPAEPAEAFAPSVLVQAALAEHLDEHGVTDAPAQAALVVRHLVDYARGTGALPGNVVNALMKLSP